MSEWDILIYASFGLNVLFFMVFQRLQTIWSTHGSPNFFIQQIKWGFNRIKNPKIVFGANSSRYAPLYIAGDNEPIYPDPSNKTTLPLQYEPKNVYHGPRGIPVIFAFQGEVKNVNPLETTNDDIELQQLAQATEKFIQVEVDRRYAKDNPFKKLSNLLLVHGAVMVMGFIILGVILMNIQSVAGGIGDVVVKYQPILEKILSDPAKYGIPVNIIGPNPATPAPPQIIPGII